MVSIWSKRDKDGQILQEGDVCVRAITKKSGIEFCVYKGEAWGGNGSKGEFGRFITPGGVRSIKYTSVLFAFDPMGKRRANTDEVKQLIREFYEDK